MKLYLPVLLLLSMHIHILGQTNKYSEYGWLYRFEISNAPFPAPARENGHIYRDTHYPKETHYNDSTVLVFVPDYMRMKDKLDIVVYFHGWNNNVDTVLSQFNLIEQIHASQRQAILVMPEGPKNAPDSFGGKLEDTRRFRLFIDEVLSELQKTNVGQKQMIQTSDKMFSAGNIILAGHRSAYRVISRILMRGGMTGKIKEVYLFDGLYADVEKYSYWLDHYKGRFINIYTPKGGTKGESENLMECLTAWGIPYSFIDGDSFTSNQLKSGRIIFIRSSLSHNDVISKQDQLKIFLQSSKLK